MTKRDVSRRVQALSILIILTSVSIGLGIAWYRHQHRVLSAPITMRSKEVDEDFQVLRPNLRDAEMVIPDRPHDPSETRAPDRFERLKRRRSFTVSTNSHGMRGPEFSVPAPGYRILCAGDSVTFGWGVSYDESFPALLAKRLGVEVLNAGVPGMRPESVARWVQHHAKDLDVDLVLFTRRPDRSHPGPIQSYVDAIRQMAAALGPIPLGVILPPISTFDVKGSQNIDQELREVTAALAPIPVLDPTPAFRAALPLPGVILEQQTGRQRLVKLPDHKLLLEAVAQAGLAKEIEVAFERDRTVHEPLFFDGGHPDAEGFKVFARVVADWVVQRGWVKEPAR